MSRVNPVICPGEWVGVVYSIFCSCGKIYISETGRTFSSRMLEYKQAVKHGDPHNAISVNANSTHWTLNWLDKVLHPGIWGQMEKKKVQRINVNKKTTYTREITGSWNSLWIKWGRCEITWPHPFWPSYHVLYHASHHHICYHYSNSYYTSYLFTNHPNRCLHCSYRCSSSHVSGNDPTNSQLLSCRS